MSNKFNFEIPAQLAVQDFKIVAINADGTSSVIENGANSASDEEKLAILKAAIEESKKFTSLEDKDFTKVGYYSSDDLAKLKGYVADGNDAINNEDVANFLTIADKINKEILWLQASNCIKQIIPNAIYTILCKRDVNGENRYLSSTDAFEFITKTSILSSAKNDKWVFIPVEDQPNTYLMMNKNYHMLKEVLNEKNKISGVKTTDTIPDGACTVTIEQLSGGVLGIRPKNETYVHMRTDGFVTVWGDADQGSSWYISEHEVFTALTEDDINKLMTETEDLLNDVSVYTVTQTKVDLQTNNASGAGYLSTNATSQKWYPFADAIDGSEETDFRIDESKTTSTPHLIVDLGKTSKHVQFYISGNYNGGYAKTAEVYGSTNGTDWTKVEDIVNMSMNYTSNPIKSNTAYRYWKIVLTSSSKGASNAKTIAINEFEFYTVTTSTTMKEGFTKNTIKNATNNCREALENMENALKAAYRTAISDYLAYEELQTRYDKLYNLAVKIDPTVDINDVEGSKDLQDDNSGIFDLSGRRVENACKGVFIVNGKKVIK
jgi:hypothetical protein